MLQCHVTPNQVIFILVDIYWIIYVKLQEYICSSSLFINLQQLVRNESISVQSEMTEASKPMNM